MSVLYAGSRSLWFEGFPQTIQAYTQPVDFLLLRYSSHFQPDRLGDRLGDGNILKSDSKGILTS